MPFEKLTLKLFYSRLMRLLNDRVYLQFRPTFCRADNPRVANKSLYDLLREDWKINDRGDLVRYYIFYLQLQRLDSRKIPGDIAELGVYKGNTALFMSHVSPDRKLHLFDTFSGFSEKDSKKFATDKTFKDVSLEEVRRRFRENVNFYPGYFPESAASLQFDSQFALVHLDMDLEAPIAAALEYFYPKMSPGGVIIVHDYNYTGNWDCGAKKAVDRFLADKPETGIEMPDRFGSIVIAKISNTSNG